MFIVYSHHKHPKYLGRKCNISLLEIFLATALIIPFYLASTLEKSFAEHIWTTFWWIYLQHKFLIADNKHCGMMKAKLWRFVSIIDTHENAKTTMTTVWNDWVEIVWVVFQWPTRKLISYFGHCTQLSIVSCSLFVSVFFFSFFSSLYTV